MKVSSAMFEHNSYIPSKYTCDGQNINPPLSIRDVPAETKSLVLIMDDPDAPIKTWLHWTVWNIDPATSEVPENSCPDNSIECVTSFGRTGYGGPCPPSGTHRYFFKLYALDRMLDLSFKAGLTEIEKSMEGHIIEKAELIGLYKRQ